MAFFFNFLTIFIFGWACGRVLAAKQGITMQDKIYAMEDMMIDESSFLIAIQPCEAFIGGGQPEITGEQTTAQWVRMVFHDFITADVGAGTGGLDASLIFESNRAENTGLHFVNDTAGFFLGSVSAYVSMADMIAIGAIISLQECSPSGLVPTIPMRVGRVDATQAGPFGVPEQFTDINTTLTTFTKAGFNQSEAIMAVACGHSLGGVQQVNFPDIVPADHVTPNNTDGRDSFDSSPAIFDHTGIIEYLTGTGACGGPLVIGHNVTTRSDLRLFNSDNNATMQSLATPESFKGKCAFIFERMMNTVPKEVVLSDPILPMKWKVIDYNYNLTDDGILSVSGMIRFLCADGAPCTTLDTVSYTYDTTEGKTDEIQTSPLPRTDGTNTTIECGTLLTKTLFHGSFANYCFFTNLTTGTTAINVQNEYHHELETDVFLLLDRFSLAFNPNSTFPTIFITGAALTTLIDSSNPLMKVIIYIPPIRLGNGVVEMEMSLAAIGVAGNYTIFSGSAEYIGGFSLPVVQAMVGGKWSASRAVKSITFRFPDGSGGGVSSISVSGPTPAPTPVPGRRSEESVNMA